MEESHCSFSQAQFSQKYDGDFLADVLCNDIKEMSLHDIKQTIEKPCSSSSDSDNENVLPLLQRLHRQTLINNKNILVDNEKEIVVVEEDKNAIDKVIITGTSNGTKAVSSSLQPKSPVINSSIKDTSSNRKFEQLGSEISPNKNISLIDDLGSEYFIQKKHLNVMSSNSINSSKLPTPSINKLNDVKISPLEQVYNTPHRVKNHLSDHTGMILVENTPICFQQETPIFKNYRSVTLHSNHSSVLVSSTPLSTETNQPSMKNKRSPLLQDITNFSNLGDSILGNSMDLFDACDDIERIVTCGTTLNIVPKSNGESILWDSLDLCEPNNNLISKLSAFGDSILCESLDLANVSLDRKHKLSQSTHDNRGKVMAPELSVNYEDLLREKFQISLSCDDASVGDISKCSNNSPSCRHNNSTVEGSPLCLADRLKVACMRR